MKVPAVQPLQIFKQSRLTRKEKVTHERHSGYSRRARCHLSTLKGLPSTLSSLSRVLTQYTPGRIVTLRRVTLGVTKHVSRTGGSEDLVPVFFVCSCAYLFFSCLFIRLGLNLNLCLCCRRGLVLVVTRCRRNFPSHLEPPPPRKRKCHLEENYCAQPLLFGSNRLKILKFYYFSWARGVGGEKVFPPCDFT